MFRRITMLVLCVLLAMSFAGCTEKEPETTAAQIKPRCVMINGEIWQDRNLEVKDISISEDEILGRITFTVKNTSMPKRNNEGNYAKAMNAPYAAWTDAEYGEVYVLQYGGSWHILVPEDYPIG